MRILFYGLVVMSLFGCGQGADDAAPMSEQTAPVNESAGNSAPTASSDQIPTSNRANTQPRNLEVAPPDASVVVSDAEPMSAPEPEPMIEMMPPAADMTPEVSSRVVVTNETASISRMESVAPQENEDYTLVSVYYATDRKGEKGDKHFIHFGGKRGTLSYGVSEVSIPKTHQVGELEAPSIFKFEFREDPKKHVALLDVIQMPLNTFLSSVKAKVASSEGKNAFIFIHGYNVSFEDAARRTAQITYDLNFDGAPVLYSWPSDADTKKYIADEADIRWTQANLEKFITQFAKESGAQNIYLVAHSMGSRAATRAYASFTEKQPTLAKKFTEIILAAPDIDAAIFKRDIAPRMIQAGNPITLYASSEDIALKASKEFHGAPRLGDSGEGGENILVMNGIESIDATKVRTSFLGHSHFEENSVIDDMYYIVQHNMRAEGRSGLKKITASDGQYWAFK